MDKNMNQVKALIINKEKIYVLSQFILLTGIAVTAPLLGFQQAISGPIINAVLFISVVLLGVRGAILIALVPSLIALSVGLLPPVLAPMIPFIMTSNAILILAFSYLREKNYWLAIISASLMKFLFLWGTSLIVIDLLLKKEIASKVAMTMSWPQLLTALAGGLIAYLFLKSFKVRPFKY